MVQYWNWLDRRKTGRGTLDELGNTILPLVSNG